MIRKCVCGKRIKDKHKLCTACEEIYGSRDEWPEWLRFWVNDTEREYEAEKLLYKREVQYSDLASEGFDEDELENFE